MNAATSTLMNSLQRKIFILITVVTCVGFIGISDITSSYDETNLSPLYTAKIDTSTKYLLQKMSALELSASMAPRLAVVFNGALNQTPEFTYLAIMDEKKDLLVEAGDRPGGLVNLDQKQPQQFFDEQIIHVHPLSGTALSTRLRGPRGGHGSVLLVGTKNGGLRGHLFDRLPVLLSALLAIVWLGFEIVRSVLNIHMRIPFQVLADQMARIRVGDFRSKIPPQPSNPFTNMAKSLNTFVNRINGHFVVMQILAGDLETNGDPANQQTRKRLSAHMAQLLDRFYFAEDGKTPPASPAPASAIRLPLFLLSFTELLTYSFFPNFAAEFHTPESGLDIHLFMALPLSLFFAAAALASATVHFWSARLPLNTILIIAALLSFVGYGGLAFSTSLYDLLIWRGITGLAIGLFFAACQKFVLPFAAPDSFSGSMNTFSRPLLAGGLLGVSFGGVLASHLLFSEVVLIAALCALISAVTLMGTLRHLSEIWPDLGQSEAPCGFFTLLSTTRFSVFLILAILPSRAVLSGVFFLLIPVYLSELGFGPVETGWVLAAAALINFILLPVFAGLADRYSLVKLPIFTGFLFIGAAAVSLTQWQNALTVISVAIIIGFGLAFNLAPTLAALPKLCAKEFSSPDRARVVMIYRAVEAVGMLAGPLILAGLAGTMGYGQILYSIGGAILLIAALFGIFFSIFRLQPKVPDDAPHP